METDEEDNSGRALQFHNDSAFPTVTPATTAEPGTSKELPFADPQCGPLPQAEISVRQLSAGDGESEFIPPETDTKLPNTRDYRDVVAGDNSSAVDVIEFQVGGSGNDSQSPRSLIPQLPMAGGDHDKSAQAEEEGRGIEPLEIPQEIPGKNEKDGDLMPREGGREAREDSDLALNKDNNGEGEGEVDEDMDDMDVGGEFPEAIEGTETKKEVVAEVDNSVMATDEVVTGVIDEPTMAYKDKESLDKMGVEEESKEEVSDVVEGTEITDTAEELEEVKEENENEAEVEEKQVVSREESMLVDEEAVLLTEMSEIAEETEAAEEALKEAGQTDEMNTADGMEEEERDVANAVADMDVTEEAEDTEGGDNAEETEEGDDAEEVEEGDDAEETEEGDIPEEIETADGTEEAADEVEEVSRNSGGKRKRGKNAKAPARTSSRKKLEEDVCFICFDGGELVLCDRRGCPKAYHPTCVNRDDAFFRARGRWNCGWHLCSNCEKNAYYMCYTCTFSLCKGCIKDAVILCVRGNKGFCESCMKTVMLIERNEQGNKEMAQVDFDDRSSFEYLFKDYWVELKGKLSLTLDELSQAKSPRKGSELSAGKRESRDELYDIQNDGESGSDNSGNPEVNPSKRRRAKKRLKSHSKERESTITKNLNDTQEALADESTEWASKELLEFIMHMKNGDKSVCTQFDVQALLLEYIKRNKLRDPRRKSQIICDSRFQKLFGKPRVGHFEMLKLLESHFLLKEDSQADDLQGSVVDTEANQSEVDGNSDGVVKGTKDRRRRSRKKNDGRGLQSNLDDYAAIDTDNINLIYLRRSLVESLIDDTETFHHKVVGAFARIRISGSAQKQDIYRLVQVVGTNKAAEPYKVGKKTTEFLLEILNLNKTEIVSIDIISNQDFTEDECKRLRQSIKCGLINRLTVGDIQEKAMALQAVRVEDSLETEITRYQHLCDRASDLGRRKQLRECVEKLQLLKSPGERQRRLEEIPEVHADPNMDPSYESEEDEDEMDDKKQENSLRSGGTSFNRRGRDPISPGRGNLSSIEPWSGARGYLSTNRDYRSSSSKGFSIKGDDVPGGSEMLNENLWTQGSDKETQHSQSWDRPKSVPNLDNKSVHSLLPSESIPSVKQEIAVGPSSKPVVPSTTKVNETDKIWHYKDPSGKIQGPFSMVQLRKWSNTGYFPADLRIWRATEKQDDSILLTDALAGNFQKDPQVVDSSFPNTQSFPSRYEITRATPAPLEISKYTSDKWDAETNLPSPTPVQAARSGTKAQPHESKWSPTPGQSVGSHLGTNPHSVGNGELRHSSLVIPRMLSQSTLPSESPRIQGSSHLISAPNSSGASVNVAVDLKNLQNLVRPVAVTNPLAGTQGTGTGTVSASIPGSGSQMWGSVPSQRIEQNNSMSGSSQPSAYGGWGDLPSSIHNSASSFVAGNPTGVPSAVPPSDIWRGTITGQPSIQPSAASNVPWGMSVPGNQTVAHRPGPENQNSGWGPPIAGNTNMGWGGSVPANANQVWVGSGQQGPAPGNNPNPGWIAHGQGHAPVNANAGWTGPAQGQAPGNAFPGWVPPAQGPGPGPGPGPVPVNMNQGWVAPGPGQGPPQGNGNSSRPASKGNNMGPWGSEKGGDRFGSRRDGGSQGGDSGYGGGKPWNNRQQSYNRGGDSSRAPSKGQRVCKYHESGHCRKGAQCDYLHT
ncbi:zinc finger CCCH domain-containing protein 19 [Euphorbia lathyris]|uniref:zinc finger CCCH domain-containing protein 19 n=1 Tax=Euphorbia lathyris TaxID=212925 RepID=UPI003314217E